VTADGSGGLGRGGPDAPDVERGLRGDVARADLCVEGVAQARSGSSDLGQAAVHEHLAPGHEAAVVRGEEQRHRRRLRGIG
jgi:hypothetical protein